MATVAILGGGISGRMMSKRLRMMCPDLDIVVLDKGIDSNDHVFHLHRTIPEIPELDNNEFLKEHRFQSSVLTSDGLKNSATLKDINEYSYKVFGFLNVTNAGNSDKFTIIPIGKQKLIKALGNVGIKCCTFSNIDTSNKVIYTDDGIIGYDYLISTIPLPKLLQMANIKTTLEFKYYPFYGAHTILQRNTNTYQQLVVTSKMYGMTRLTLFDDEFYIESMDRQVLNHELREIDNIFGPNIVNNLNTNMEQYFPGRINILRQSERKPLLYWLTQEHDIFTLGRYGAWTYKIANDVWDDSKFICQMISAKEHGRNYKEITNGNQTA